MMTRPDAPSASTSQIKSANLWLKVDQHNGIPIYLQIKDAVTRSIQLGHLRPGDSLPTVRALASELRIAPNTISRAYTELQRDGIIESRAGAGTSICSDALKRLEGSHEELLSELSDVMKRLHHTGVSVEELQRHFEQIISRLTLSEAP